MLSERSSVVISNMAQVLKKPVRLIVFTTDAGCDSCPEMLELGAAVKKKLGKIALEAYDIIMDRDKASQYGITRAPAVVVQGGEGRAITLYGRIAGVTLDVLLSTILAVSEDKVWFSDEVLRALTRLTRDVRIRIFLNNDCEQCRPVAETAIGLALSCDLISSELIVSKEYPELAAKYGIAELPKTIFGENLHLDGPVTAGQFMEMIFQAEGIEEGPDKRCMICGKASPDLICAQCKTRVEAEAKNHKLKSEKMSQSGP